MMSVKSADSEPSAVGAMASSIAELELKLDQKLATITHAVDSIASNRDCNPPSDLYKKDKIEQNRAAFAYGGPDCESSPTKLFQYDLARDDSDSEEHVGAYSVACDAIVRKLHQIVHTQLAPVHSDDIGLQGNPL